MSVKAGDVLDYDASMNSISESASAISSYVRKYSFRDERHITPAMTYRTQELAERLREVCEEFGLK